MSLFGLSVADLRRLFSELHNNGDTDSDRTAIHHTLGIRPTQAAPGDHQHEYEYAPVEITDPWIKFPAVGWSISSQGWWVNPWTRQFFGHVTMKYVGTNAITVNSIGNVPNTIVADYDPAAWDLVTDCPGVAGETGRMASWHLRTSDKKLVLNSVAPGSNITQNEDFKIYCFGIMQAYLGKPGAVTQSPIIVPRTVR